MAAPGSGRVPEPGAVLWLAVGSVFVVVFGVVEALGLAEVDEFAQMVGAVADHAPDDAAVGDDVAGPPGVGFVQFAGGGDLLLEIFVGSVQGGQGFGFAARLLR